MALYYRIDCRVLKYKMLATPEKRVTISFYKDHHLSDPVAFRDQLYSDFEALGVFGRIFLAS